MHAEITGAIEHDDHEGAEESGTGQKQNALGYGFLLGAGLIVMVKVAVTVMSVIAGTMRCREFGSIQQVAVVSGNLGRSSRDGLCIACVLGLRRLVLAGRVRGMRAGACRQHRHSQKYR